MSDDNGKAERFYRIRRKSDGWYASRFGIGFLWRPNTDDAEKFYAHEDATREMDNVVGCLCELVECEVREVSPAAPPPVPAGNAEGAERSRAVADAKREGWRLGIADEREACLRALAQPIAAMEDVDKNSIGAPLAKYVLDILRAIDSEIRARAAAPVDARPDGGDRGEGEVGRG